MKTALIMTSMTSMKNVLLILRASVKKIIRKVILHFLLSSYIRSGASGWMRECHLNTSTQISTKHNWWLLIWIINSNCSTHFLYDNLITCMHVNCIIFYTNTCSCIVFYTNDSRTYTSSVQLIMDLIQKIDRVYLKEMVVSLKHKFFN